MSNWGLPEGITPAAVAAVLIPIALVTIALRQAPFSARRLLRRSKFLSTLGMTMPVGVMVVLVVYTLNAQRTAPGGLLAAGLALLATLGLHAWRRDSGLSILGGTACYMILVNLVF
ncbi:AzlD domain-containing protein [Corynebacterium uberis]|uniref:AzlD domain-containing protein n=1 Tax=Corynebacterium TaxID=1716 RepID=UPI001D0B61D7|nr:MULTISPECIES: AzlD domain-containing protein [Corynebacterium]MCZ9310170.1 AzlD domain-containing protein [Corynebacterium sp. c6VSa_13]UDL73308.1 AzlD domain-containing protein [Corynebacterium uberis]UDL75814.1 AzlD domain-containing protein [Corynebacterium uberis]UDL78027.1 AzlD domain-containing protein [Corynebacterium uberis]UDL80309.1 AzlD domain-containing protein [Corynebacterium uberis]